MAQKYYQAWRDVIDERLKKSENKPLKTKSKSKKKILPKDEGHQKVLKILFTAERYQEQKMKKLNWFYNPNEYNASVPRTAENAMNPMFYFLHYDEEKDEIISIL